MEKEARTAVYDLGIESYRLEGLSRPFPKHFHRHSVLGLVESGERTLSCKDALYKISAGNSIFIFLRRFSIFGKQVQIFFDIFRRELTEIK